jgi:hypothetical protein
VYAEKKLEELSYVAQYDPFMLPQAAEEPPKQEGPTHVRKKWALVVGIDQYQDEHVPRLNFAVKDSQDFEEFLKDLIHLVDQKATLTGMRQALGKLRAEVQKDDLVVLYFSGHGSPREMDPNGMSYIITGEEQRCCVRRACDAGSGCGRVSTPKLKSFPIDYLGLPLNP